MGIRSEQVKRNNLKLSNYLTTTAFDKNNLLIASGITGSIIKIDKNRFNAIKSEMEHNQFSKNNKKQIQLLRKQGIITCNNTDEKEKIRKIFRRAFNEKSDHIGKTFLLTYNCNFCCPYCYETTKNIDMTKDTANLILKDLFKTAIKERRKSMRISFFGGEPLLKKDIILFIVTKCRKFCKKHGVKLTFSIITNGSLFNKDVAKIFSKGDLEHVQITIDGPKEIHDKMRMYRTGKGSYDDIFLNIPKIMKVAKRVMIRINIDHRNVMHIPELLNNLRKFSGRNLKVYFARINNFDGRGKNRKNKINIKKFSQKILELEKIAINDKLMERKRPFKTKTIYCSASIADPGWVDPKGDIYCCQHAVGSVELSIGTIFKGINKNTKKDWLKYNLLNNEKCMNCKQVFFCGGACSMFFKKNYIGQDFCHNFDKILVSRFK